MVDARLLDLARLGARGLQAAFSLIALFTTAAGFEGTKFGDYPVSLGSSTTTFAMLITYTSMLYSIWWVAAVEILRFAPRPQLRVEQAIDVVLAVLLLIAGIAFAASHYVSDCDVYNALAAGLGLHCSNLKAGVAFTFLAFAMFLVTLALNFVPESIKQEQYNEDVQVAEPVPYHSEATPTGQLSPIGNTKSPSANV